MKRHLLFPVLLLLNLAACQDGSHLATLSDGTVVKTFALNIDVPCDSVSDCLDTVGKPLVSKHQCGGPICEQGKCQASWLMTDECLNSDGSIKASDCGSDADCANSNTCTATQCNPYLLDGICLTSNIPGLPKLPGGVCGIGACLTVVYECKDGAPNSDQCVPGLPISEICNAADDDCNGVVDDKDFGSTTCGKGVCEHSVANCVAGVPQTCDPMQGVGVDICNGLDDDCDNAVDEDYVLGAACDGLDDDLCKEGVTVCKADGTDIECNDVTETNIDICNGFDDDCDGAIDEDYPTKGQACDGVDSDFCKFGNFTCKADGSGVGCVNEVVTDVVEVCDNKDNDCDGSVDEENATGCTTHYYDNDSDSYGANGNTKCLCGPSGKYSAMVDSDCDDGNAAVHPNAVELCNVVDDDCDGAIDEDYPTKGQACDGADSDFCKYGTNTCTANGLAVECVNENPSGLVEACDGEDNDCDNTVDEGFGSTTCGQGGCDHTIANCLAGQVQTCDPLQGASPETCNSKDDD